MLKVKVYSNLTLEISFMIIIEYGIYFSVIGDEILKGQTQDTNTQFLTKNLHKLGVKVEKVS